ncbi:MAG: hypothetical protein GY765_07395 [bacterium]|nr:hypothetical protein [bacterium]
MQHQKKQHPHTPFTQKEFHLTTANHTTIYHHYSSIHKSVDIEQNKEFIKHFHNFGDLQSFFFLLLSTPIFSGKRRNTNSEALQTLLKDTSSTKQSDVGMDSLRRKNRSTIEILREMGNAYKKKK